MKLALYHRQACPFSARVRKFIEKNALRPYVEYRDINTNKQALDELLQLTRDEQVPCLVADGHALTEADQIISWLDENLVKRAKDLEADRKAG